MHGARDERELQKQLAEIDRAAREAVAFDKLHPNSSSAFPVSVPIAVHILCLCTSGYKHCKEMGNAVFGGTAS